MPQQEATTEPWYATSRFCKFIIVFASLAWGFSFVLLKDILNTFPVFFVLTFRFTVASIVLLAVFGKRFFSNMDPATIRAGLLIGLMCWLGYTLQTIGMVYTTPGKNAFISGSYCVMVPFAAWVLGMGKPERTHVLGAILCVIGLGFVGLDGTLTPNVGDALTLACAVVYAVEYAYMGKKALSMDVWALTIWQFLVMAVLSALGMLFTGHFPAPETLTVPNIMGLVMLAVVCSCIASAGVNYALTKVDPTTAALLSSLESPFGVCFSVLLLNEVLTQRIIVGFIFIFCAVLISEVGPAIITALPDFPRTARDRR